MSIHPKGYKERTLAAEIEDAPLPKEAVVPMVQHLGAPASPVVSVGDRVDVGMLIASSDKFISAPVHSPISGTVKAIEPRPHPVVEEALSIIIESDEENRMCPSIKRQAEDITQLSAEQIKTFIKEAGIVGLGGAAFPAFVKLSPPKGKQIDTFILNGAECEPYLTCDYHLMLSRPEEILTGMQLIMKVLSLKRGFVAIEDNKQKAIEVMRNKLQSKIAGSADFRGIEVVVLKSQYPQGAEKQLIKTVLGKEVPSGGLPMDVGCVVHNVATASAVYEAAAFNKPLYERVVTITGRGIKRPANLRVRLGTTFRELIDLCGGLEEDTAKLIMGGPMMGLTQWTLDVPVIKGTSGILALREDEVSLFEDAPCIRCGRCVDACPTNLLPTDLGRVVRKQKWERMDEFNIMDCIECGCCVYVCPAKIPLVQLIRLGKARKRMQKV